MDLNGKNMSRSNPSTNMKNDIKNIKDFEDEFYSKIFYFSYSGLQKLLFSPVLFYKHYILNQKEDGLSEHLISGKIIHCLLLDNGSFEKQFIVSPSNIPTGNNRIVMDKLFILAKLQDKVDDIVSMSQEIVYILKDINLHQSLKTDQQRIDKILTDENINYYNYLKEKGGRDIIDDEILTKCKESVELLSGNTRVRQLLYLDSKDLNIDICNECYINIEPDKYPFGFKGIIDNHVVDHTNKIIYINDLKTTGKTLSEFKESIEYFRYDIQAAIYIHMVNKKYKIDSSWRIIFNFIVIDKYRQVYCFELTEETMKLWKDKLNDTLEIANYHYKSKDFSLPYQFCTEKVML